MDVEYLDLEDALRLVAMAGMGPVGDLGLLDPILAQPRSSAFGQSAYPSLHLKAAALLYPLVGNHALVDGSRRLGWLARVTFLGINGCEAAPGDDEAFELVRDVAAGPLDRSEIVLRLAPGPPRG